MPTHVFRTYIRPSLVAWIASATVMIPLAGALDVLVVNGNSMAPTLKDGQRILVVNTRVIEYLPGGSYFWLKRDAIVVVSHHRTNGRRWVKRLVGVGGDRIQLQENHLTVNDTGSDNRTGLGSAGAIFGLSRDIVVPPNQYFVVSDNRSAGLDSRSVGPFPRSAVVGVVLSLTN